MGDLVQVKHVKLGQATIVERTIARSFIYLINVAMGNKLVLFLLLSIFAYSKEVLLLHSYHKGYEWTDSISEAVGDSFQDSDVEISTEYMDTKRIHTKKYIDSL